MDEGLQILTNFGKICDELERKRERIERRGERGRTEQARLWAGRRVYIGTSLVPVRDTNLD